MAGNAGIDLGSAAAAKSVLGSGRVRVRALPCRGGGIRRSRDLSREGDSNRVSVTISITTSYLKNERFLHRHWSYNFHFSGAVPYWRNTGQLTISSLQTGQE